MKAIQKKIFESIKLKNIKPFNLQLKVYSAYGPGLISSGKLAKICKGDEQVIGLEKVVEVSEKMLEGKITGRYIVKPE